MEIREWGDRVAFRTYINNDKQMTMKSAPSSIV